ncbi:MAG TPA: hypothetical protein VNS58_29425 [Puia sp.]|nr:hypothetical protein [Puia sp.]
MKGFNNAHLFLFATIIFLGINCKKNGGGSNSGSASSGAFVPAPVQRSQSGGIVPQSPVIRLHVGAQVTLSAKLYDQSGNITASQPSFSWSMDNSSAISLTTSGVVNALSIGDALVTVSDGSHANGYVDVIVLPDTITIPAGPANIVFSKPFIGLTKGQSQTFSYTITDYNGNIVNETPAFQFLGSASGIAISGKTITANQDGVYQLYATNNNIILNGSLQVIVNSSLTDTVRSISFNGTFPNLFNRYDSSSKIPLTINVYILYYPNSGFLYEDWYSISPDSIQIEHPDVVNMENGFLTSRYPGSTKITAIYKGSKTAATTRVGIDWVGSWGGSGKKLDYNFCVLENDADEFFWQTNKTILYGPSPLQIHGNPDWDNYLTNGAPSANCIGCHDGHVTANIFSGSQNYVFDTTDIIGWGNLILPDGKLAIGGGIIVLYVNPNFPGITQTVEGGRHFDFGTFSWLNDKNKMLFTDQNTGEAVQLTRGTGNCVPVGSISLPADTVGSFSFAGTNYSGLCTSEPDVSGCSGIDVPIYTSTGNFIVYNMPTATSGSFTFGNDISSCNLYGLCTIGVITPVIYVTQSGTVTKTGANSFTFSCTVYDIANATTTYTITGGGTY